MSDKYIYLSLPAEKKYLRQLNIRPAWAFSLCWPLFIAKMQRNWTI